MVHTSQLSETDTCQLETVESSCPSSMSVVCKTDWLVNAKQLGADVSKAPRKNAVTAAIRRFQPQDRRLRRKIVMSCTGGRPEVVAELAIDHNACSRWLQTELFLRLNVRGRGQP